MADDDRCERALTKLEEVFGPRPPAQPQEGIPDLLSEVGRTCVEYCYGDAWSRPGIDAKTRSFVTIGVLTALGAQDELALHIRGALRLGHTKEGVAELLIAPHPLLRRSAGGPCTAPRPPGFSRNPSRLTSPTLRPEVSTRLQPSRRCPVHSLPCADAGAGGKATRMRLEKTSRRLARRGPAASPFG